MGLKDLKGGMETRKLSEKYNKGFDEMKKDCGCKFGEKCNHASRYRQCGDLVHGQDQSS